jgi:hypothetical protein
MGGREEVTGDWGKFHNEELLYFSPDIICMIKLSCLTWVGKLEETTWNTLAYMAQ